MVIEKYQRYAPRVRPWVAFADLLKIRAEELKEHGDRNGSMAETLIGVTLLGVSTIAVQVAEMVSKGEL
jgi:hypothetical protein